MTDTPQTDAQKIRRRWINLGEFVAVAGLFISGLALWNSWGGRGPDEKTVIEKEAKPIPLALKGRIEDDGKLLVLSPVESGHALDSLTLTANGHELNAGSDGRISAVEVENLLAEKGERKGDGRVSVKIAARYVELGNDRHGGGRYVIAYRWVDGGLFSGKSLRLTAFNRG